MKRLAGMQPYFFPYIGYWQLINAVDCFVLFDESQYMKQGWVNRNRILKPNGGWQYILVPLRKHSVSDSIRDVQLVPDVSWKSRIARQLHHYKGSANFFVDAKEIIETVLYDCNSTSIGGINCEIIRQLCAYQGIGTELIVSSEYPFDYEEVAAPGDWAAAHCKQLGADQLINPVSGAHLFDAKKFELLNLGLSFLRPDDINYDQAVTFEPSLSIIDVLMFNGVEGTKALLTKCQIECVVQHRGPAASSREEARLDSSTNGPLRRTNGAAV